MDIIIQIEALLPTDCQANEVAQSQQDLKFAYCFGPCIGRAARGCVVLIYYMQLLKSHLAFVDPRLCNE